MALSEAEHAVLLEAGTAPDPNVRHRAVAIVLNKATSGRTYTLSTLEQLLLLPAVASLRQ